jgi:hypothetical protein
MGLPDVVVQPMWAKYSSRRKLKPPSEKSR